METQRHSKCCDDIVEVSTWKDAHEDRHARLDKLVGEMQTDIKFIRDALANRPPLWATLAITLLAGAVGWFAHI